VHPNMKQNAGITKYLNDSRKTTTTNRKKAQGTKVRRPGVATRNVEKKGQEPAAAKEKEKKGLQGWTKS